MKRSVFIVGAVATTCLWLSPAYAGSAREAWVSIVGEKRADWPEFAYVEPGSNLPNVLLYGDSISIGYTVQVREGLKGKANVFRLHSNGNHSGLFKKLMNEMERTMRNPELDAPWTHQWDVIHFNVGLHDLKYVLNGKKDFAGEQVSSIEVYQKNLREIIVYLKNRFPQARLIFATTTPVPEGAEGRKTGDAAAYNQAALEIMKEHPEIVINDLYGFTQPNHATWWTKPGNVHYNKIGSTAQGDEVARVILKVLTDNAASM